MPTLGNVTNTGALEDKATHSFTHVNDGDVLAISLQSRGATVTGITYNSVAMVKITSQGRNDYDSELWYMKSPPVGSYTVAVTMSGTANELGLSAISLHSVDASQDYHSKDEATAGSGTPSASVVTTVPDCIVIDSVWHDSSGAISVGADQVQIHNYNFVPTGYNGQAGCSYELAPSIATITMSWSGLSGDWACCACSFIGGGFVPVINLI